MHARRSLTAMYCALGAQALLWLLVSLMDPLGFRRQEDIIIWTLFWIYSLPMRGLAPLVGEKFMTAQEYFIPFGFAVMAIAAVTYAVLVALLVDSLRWLRGRRANI